MTLVFGIPICIAFVIGITSLLFSHPVDDDEMREDGIR